MGTILKILRCGKSAVFTAAVCSSPASAHTGQVGLPYLHILSPGNPASHLRIQFIKGVAAGHPHIIMPVPPETGNKKETQICVCHKHLAPAVLPADTADHHLGKVKFLLTIRDSHNKKHQPISSQIPLLKADNASRNLLYVFLSVPSTSYALSDYVNT